MSTAEDTTTAAGTTVATRAPRMLDVDGAKVSKKFLDAYTSGNLNRLSADEQATFLFALGARIGVKPELGELMLYQGKPYITIDGRFRMAHESGLLVGVETRPATQMERRNFGVDSDADALWVCDVYRRGSGRPFRGWGHVAPAKERNPVGKSHPREMAKKRAKYDALRTAFPPSETVSAMHERYIEEAEAELRAGRGVFATPALLASGEYVEGAEERAHETEGEVLAADNGTGREPGEE